MFKNCTFVDSHDGYAIVKTYDFVLGIGPLELTDDVVDRLYEAGCDDATIGSRDGSAFIEFARESKSLEDAIRSAINSVKKAGIDVLETRVPVQ